MATANVFMSNQGLNSLINEEALEQLASLSPATLAAAFSNWFGKEAKAKANLKSYEVADAYIEAYREAGGTCLCLWEGSLGSGNWILYGDGLKTTIIHEVYVNSWSSGHRIRSYNKCPKKYAAIIEAYENGDIDDDTREHDGCAVFTNTGKPVVF